VLAATTDVGARNIEFVRGYLHGEGYRIAGEDLGGSHARQVNYFPATGRVQVRRLASERNAVVAARERHYLRELGSTAEADSG
jgi:chemotaxis protein CheD